MKTKKLLTRAVSGAVYVALIVGTMLCGTPGVMALAILFCILGVIEFEKLYHALSFRRLLPIILDVIGGICLCLCLYPVARLMWIAVLLIRFITELYSKSTTPLIDACRSLMAQIYLGIPLGLMVMLSDFTGSSMIILLLFIFIWLNDTGAFLVGSAIGRRKLFERISPNKSWEGFFGGLCFNLILAAILCTTCAGTFSLPSYLPLWLCLATIVTVFSTWGDLFESLLKRSLHIKDSGNLIPGHGGILDRIDSLLFVMSAAYLFFYML
ncbi:MAG: phosphatidate cytidylyltransferase [Muribaculaceae bacterium]|nr:phosphatidate cytidylyltransferase [Muribaculaceae bacterium]